MLVGFQDFLASGESTSRFDICIAGGGVAGITIARELARQNKRVLLLEGGDLDFTDESQDLYSGEIVNREYYSLDICRLRYLGGTSNHWSGFCAPLDDFDFETRPDVEAFGWPIEKADLNPWLKPAADIIEIESDFPEDILIEQADNNLRQIATHFSPPVRFGEKYLAELKDDPNIWTVLNASVNDIKIDTASGTIQHFDIVYTNDPDQKFEAVADHFVLALGGIENARVLLNADGQITKGIGNDNDLVGRYFMEHIELDAGFALLNAPMSELFESPILHEMVGEAVSFSITRDFARSAGILNLEMRLEAFGTSKVDTSRTLKSRIKRMLCSSDVAVDLLSYVDERFKHEKCRHAHRVAEKPADEFDGVIRLRSEQAPNFNSRVLLTDDRDRLGMRKVALDWQLLDVDKATIRKAVLELGRYFANAEVGRLRMADWILDEERDVPSMAEGERGAGFHHMGTTRMAATPARGVVDRNCKVFGTNNLYVGGSSVFPTGGQAPPTLTITQLALRLADHLAVRGS